MTVVIRSISLDEEAFKVWESIPAGGKTALVNGLLKQWELDKSESPFVVYNESGTEVVWKCKKADLATEVRNFVSRIRSLEEDVRVLRGKQTVCAELGIDK